MQKKCNYNLIKKNTHTLTQALTSCNLSNGVK